MPADNINKSGRQESFRIQKPHQRPTNTGSTIQSSRSSGDSKDQVGGESTWIDFNAVSSDRSRKDVRSQAARASAAARRATLAKKAARQGQQPGSLVFSLPMPSPPQRKSPPVPAPPVKTTIITTPTPQRPANAVAALEQAVVRHAAQAQSSPDQVYFQQMVDIVTRFLDDRPTSLCQKGEISLAHSSIRSMLWNAMTGNTTLFQVSLFLAGTYSNTCGLPRQALRHIGAGLAVLRGASLNAIQEKLAVADAESIAPVAIALLAGWERRYGDQQSYEVHMKAWKILAIPGRSLEEQNVATLTDLALEMYRGSLDDGGQRTRSMGHLASIPAGFRVFDMQRVEMRSLLSLVAQMALYEPHSKTEPMRLRHVALENMSWSPTHTHGFEPGPDYEDSYDPAVLSALYHVRAANINICGVLLQHTMNVHKIFWNFDMKGGMTIHTCSCRHLQTELLMGTQYEYIALWARFMLCAIARDPVQDSLLISMLHRMKIYAWPQLRAVFLSLLYDDQLMGGFCEAVFDILVAHPEWGGNDRRPSASLVSRSEISYQA
ncbi:hypothetical protein LTR86_003305 [Recurvomyces mirabilis]|nr:hypothetical protein LTR86_003305 [Recurvomyces mirabilis]